MDEEWKQTLDDFGRVWPRVGGMGPPPPPDRPKPEHGPGPGTPPPPPASKEDVRELAELIRMEAEAGQRYRAISARTHGKAAVALNRLAAGSGGILKKLQAEYYLRTGNTVPIPREQFRGHGLQEELRRAWQKARQGETAYLNAAADTRDPELRTLYGTAAEQKQREQRELHALARRMIS